MDNDFSVGDANAENSETAEDQSASAKDEGFGSQDNSNDGSAQPFVWDSIAFTEDDVIRDESGKEYKWSEVKTLIEKATKEPKTSKASIQEDSDQNEGDGNENSRGKDPRIDALIRERFDEKVNMLSDKYPLVKKTDLRNALMTIKGASFEHIEPTMKRLQKESEDWFESKLDTYKSLKENAANADFSIERNAGNNNTSAPSNKVEDVDLRSSESIAQVFKRALGQK